MKCRCRIYFTDYVSTGKVQKPANLLICAVEDTGGPRIRIAARAERLEIEHYFILLDGDHGPTSWRTIGLPITVLALRARYGDANRLGDVRTLQFGVSSVARACAPVLRTQAQRHDLTGSSITDWRCRPILTSHPLVLRPFRGTLNRSFAKANNAPKGAFRISCAHNEFLAVVILM